MITLALAGLVAGPSALGTQSPVDDGVVLLSVRVTHMSDKERMLPVVRERIVTTLAKHGWRAEVDGATVRLVVVVSGTDDVTTSRVLLAITGSADSLTELEAFDCVGCGAGALLSAIEARVAAVASELRDVDDGRPLLGPPPLEPPPLEPPPLEPLGPAVQPSREPAALSAEVMSEPSGASEDRSMLGAGIGFVTAGAAATIAGAVGVGTSADNDNRRSASAAALGVGVLMVAVGAPLIAVSRRRARRAAINISVSRGYAGLVMSGRF